MADDRRTRARAAAGVLFFDGSGRIMLVRPTYKEHWDIPGGYVESGETPSEAAGREVREELGLDVAVGRLLVADWAPHPDDGDKLLFVFDGGTLGPAQTDRIRLRAEELASYEFVATAAAADLLIPRLARRIAAAVAAHRDERTAYLQHGDPHPR